MFNRKIFLNYQKRIKAYLDRKPHRSFRVTRRRDYKRSLVLPGYFSFTNYVNKVIWANRNTFILLAVTYAILTALLVGIASQDSYSILTNTLDSTSNGALDGALGSLGKAGLLFASAVSGNISGNLSDVQQVYAFLIIILVWLTTVWLLRNIMAGHKVKLRDGLYSAGAPLLATFLVSLLLMLQLLPFALALIGYGAANSTGLLAGGGVESMLFWAAASLLITMSLYFITSTMFALIIVTLPGMYPFKAIKTASDLVMGRRLRILFRFAWMVFVALFAWLIVMIPTILIDLWLKNIWPATNWLPIVPTMLLIMSSLTVVWVSGYVYLLYRKVVDDESR